jgi:DNA-binding NtrC family response regulator
VVEIRLPPLRERRGDIPLLARHFLGRIPKELHRERMEVSKEALAGLTSHDWPGNVRELEHALTRAVVLARGPVIGPEHLALGEGRVGGQGKEGADPLPRTLAEAEAAQVQRILSETGGNKRKSARILEISRARLDRIVERYGLSC